MNRFLPPVSLFVGLIGLTACSSEQAIPTDIEVDPIEWSTCDEYPEEENLECGSLVVPLNYADVEGKRSRSHLFEFQRLVRSQKVLF